MSLHLIRIIAVYEMRTLLRSWFFRLFTGGALLGLGIFNVAINVEASGAPWIYKALSASIPYANLIILNLGQAVVAVFLASEFLKQDRKNDSVEVIYARSMTNGQYILGKTLGILAVFLVLNFLVLILGIGFSFLSHVNSQNVIAYFAYPLLISLPTLVFILGLSFFIMVMVKNQAVTFILLIGYIALTVFYLNKKAYHLFDYIAYQVPMMYSSISGFSGFYDILLHRCIYLVLGIGLILLTVYRLQRLPQSTGYAKFPLIAGICFLLFGTLMIYHYLNRKSTIHQFREQVISLNNRYANAPKPVMDTCRLELEHRGKEIAVKAKLFMHYNNIQPLDTVIINLNPGLSVTRLTMNDHPAEFVRKQNLLLVALASSLHRGDSLEILMEYQGTINENSAFIDNGNEAFDDNPNFEVFRLRKQYAFLQKNFVCLTSESCWYPTSGTGYATDVPMQYNPDFVRFSLRVKTDHDLVPVSQGMVREVDKGIFEFQPEYPLPRISLLIGNYRKYSVEVDSLEYAIYSIKGHDYFKTYFNEISDTLSTLIRDLKKEYEAGLGLKYPFQRFMMVEVPIHFGLEQHKYAYASDAMQPEMVLYPEKGVMFSSSDFRSRKYRLEKNLKNNNEEVLPITIQTDMFTQFVRENFMGKRGQRYNYENLVNWQTYSLFPEYFTFFTQLKSEKWPVLGIALQTYASERNSTAGTTLQWFEDLTAAEKINLELSNASLETLLKTEFVTEDDSRNPVNIRDLVQVKGLHLFNLLRAKYGDKELDTLITRLITDHPHRMIPFEELNSRFIKQFNVNLADEVLEWYTQESLPGFFIRNINSYKIRDGENSKYQIRFQVSNPEHSDGIVTLNVEFNDPNRKDDGFFEDNFKVDFSRKIFLPAQSAFDVGFVFNTEPARMSIVTHISRNLPNNLIYNFTGFDETRGVPMLDDAVPMAFFDNNSGEGEYTVDNEDEGFSFKQTANQAYLKSLVNQNKDDRYKYSAIWAWNPPREWKAVLRSEMYGHYVHSAYYTRSGSGERTAAWKVALPQKGSYDVYFFLDKVNVGWRRSNKTPDYNISIYHDNGVDKINQSSEEAENGWNYLGTYSISSDTALVELSNRSNGDIIFADAVKWVLNK